MLRNRIGIAFIFFSVSFLLGACQTEESKPVNNSTTLSDKEKKETLGGTKDSSVEKEKQTVSSEKQQRVNLKSGILLGLKNVHKSANEKTSTYRTLWIAPEENKIKNVKQGNFILVPFGNEWWNIEAGKYSTTNKNEYGDSKVNIQYLFSHPAKETISIEKDIKLYAEQVKGLQQADEYAEINYVGNNYISTVFSESYQTGGTMRPYFQRTGVYKIDKINRDLKNNTPIQEGDVVPKNGLRAGTISMKSIFGEKAASYIDKYKKMEVSESEQNRFGADPIVNNTTDEFGWTLKHENGKWAAQIAKKWSFSNSSTVIENYSLYNMEIEVPKSIAAINTLTPEWNTIKASVNEAVDAISSPENDMVVIRTPSKLLVYALQDKKIQEKLLEMELDKDDSIIMAEWATGDFVKNWDAQVSKYLK